MVTFLGVARMVDATAMMGVLGWGGGDGNFVRQTTCVIANMLETMILMMMMMMMTNDHDDDDDDNDDP